MNNVVIWYSYFYQPRLINKGKPELKKYVNLTTIPKTCYLHTNKSGSKYRYKLIGFKSCSDHSLKT